MSSAGAHQAVVSPREVAKRRDDEELFILDVRHEKEYETWRIPGSHNLPIYDQLLEQDSSGLADALEELPRDRVIVVCCVAGVTSARAAAFLREHGFEARSLEDGMRGWGQLHVPYHLDTPVGVTQIVRPGTGCLSYLVHTDSQAVVIDPSLYTDEYVRLAATHGLELVGVVDTHAHADHISGAPALAREFNLLYYLPPKDAGNVDAYIPIEEGDTIGPTELTVLATPGHTPGSISLQYKDCVFTGDTLFLQGVGRPDLDDPTTAKVRAAASNLYDSLHRLAHLPPNTVVLPGHFSDEPTRPLTGRLEHVKQHNRLFGTKDRNAFIDHITTHLPDKPTNYIQIKAINQHTHPAPENAPTLELGPNNCAAN